MDGIGRLLTRAEARDFLRDRLSLHDVDIEQPPLELASGQLSTRFVEGAVFALDDRRLREVDAVSASCRIRPEDNRLRISGRVAEHFIDRITVDGDVMAMRSSQGGVLRAPILIDTLRVELGATSFERTKQAFFGEFYAGKQP